MSENSLKICNKFVDKLVTKIEDLNDNFILLSKVNKKISKKISNQVSNQVGGNSKSANNTILTAIKKKKEIETQADKLRDSLAKLKNIQVIIDNFMPTFDNITSIINQIKLGKFDIPDLTDFDESDSKKILNKNDIDEIERILSNKALIFRNFSDFTSNSNVSESLKQKIDSQGYDIIFNTIQSTVDLLPPADANSSQGVAINPGDQFEQTGLRPRNPTELERIKERLLRARRAREAREAREAAENKDSTPLPDMIYGSNSGSTSGSNSGSTNKGSPPPPDMIYGSNTYDI